MLVRALALLFVTLLALPAAALNHTRVAFPGATGEGAYTLEGWPTTPTVCRVTNYDDSGAGSFRDCVEGAVTNRIVVFALPSSADAKISLLTTLITTGNHIYVNGIGSNVQIVQDLTWPDGGSQSIWRLTGASHIAIRNVRMRGTIPSIAAGTGDVFVVGDTSADVIVADSSFAWGSDEVVDIGTATATNGPHRVTYQHLLVGDAIASGATPGYCILNNGTNTTLYQNVFACAQRLPNQEGAGLAEMRENLFYQTSTLTAPAQLFDCDGAEANPLVVLAKNNVWMHEESLTGLGNQRTINAYQQRNCAGPPTGCDGQTIYLDGNVSEWDPNHDEAQQNAILTCRDDSVGCVNGGVLSDCAAGDAETRIYTEPASQRLVPELDYDNGLFDHVLAAAGHPIEDSVDACMRGWLTNHTGGTQTVTLDTSRHAVTGGCGPLAVLVNADAPADGDSDGLTDAFEAQYGITSATADTDGDGFLNIEEMVNGTNPLVDEQHLTKVDPYAESSMRLSLSNAGCTVPCAIDVAVELSSKTPPGSTVYSIDCGVSAAIEPTPPSTATVIDRFTRQYTFSGVCQYTVAGTYKITTSAYSGSGDDLVLISQKSTSTTTVAGVNFVIESAVATDLPCPSPCTQTFVASGSGGSGNVTWAIDCNNDGICENNTGGDCSTGTSCTTNNCAAVTALGNPTVKMCATRNAVLDTADVTYRVVQQTLTATLNPPFTACTGTDCNDLDFTLSLGGSCPGIGVDVDTIGSCPAGCTTDGGFTKVNSTDNPILYNNACDCGATSGLKVFSVTPTCGTAPVRAVTAAIEVTATPEIPTFVCAAQPSPDTGDEPLLLNDVSIGYGGTATGAVTNCTVDFGDASTDFGPVDQAECVDQDTGLPFDCTGFSLKNEAGFSGHTYPTNVGSPFTVTVSGCTREAVVAADCTADVVVNDVTLPIGDLVNQLAPIDVSALSGTPNANPANVTKSLTATGQPVAYTCTDDQTWMSLSGATGTTPATLTVIFNNAGLTAGTTAHGTITCTNDANSSDVLTIAVSDTVTTPPTGTISTWTSHGGNITFNFNPPCNYKMTITGNLLVQAPCTVTSITPLVTGSGASLRNGYDINPDKSDNNTSYDGRIGIGSIGTPPTIPRTLTADQSLLKMESDTSCDGSGTNTSGSWMCFRDAAVVTALASLPACNKPLTPPFASTHKPISCWDSIDYTTLMPNPRKALLAAADQISVNDALAVFGAGGPWTREYRSYKIGRGGNLRNMRRVGAPAALTADTYADYGPWYSHAMHDGLLRITQPCTGEEAKCEEIAYRIAEIGQAWWYEHKYVEACYSDGQIFNGLKATGVWFGMLFHRQDVLDDLSGVKRLATVGTFHQCHEDQMSYYGLPGGNTALWGDLEGSGSGSCSTATSGIPDNSTTRMCSGDRDRGRLQTGTAVGVDCNTGGLKPTPAQQITNGRFAFGGYQRVTDSFFGACAAFHIITGGEAAWDWPALFDYCKRIGNAPWNGFCTGNCEGHHEAAGDPRYGWKMMDAYGP